MSTINILVTLGGGILIGFIYWFFFGKKDEVSATGSINILVSGGYKPSTIRIKRDKKTILNFLRKDPNSCLEEIVLPDFKIKKYLPLNEMVRIEIMPRQNGEFKFSCGMNMFHGKLVVE